MLSTHDVTVGGAHHRETLPSETDDAASVTVEVPLRNLLTVDALGCLLDGDLGGVAR